MAAVVYDRRSWWMLDHNQNSVQVQVDRLRIVPGGKFYDVSGYRYVRIDRELGTVESADSAGGPWLLSPEHVDQSPIAAH